MKHLIYTISLAILCCLQVSVLQSQYIDRTYELSGVNTNVNAVDTIAENIQNLIKEADSETPDFVCHISEITPIMAYFDKVQGIEPCYNWYVDNLEAKPYYLGLIKEFIEFDDNHHKVESFTKYTVLLKLPDTGPFKNSKTIEEQALAEQLSLMANNLWTGGNHTEIEMQVLKEFRISVENYLNGIGLISEQDSNGFETVQFDLGSINVGRDPNHASYLGQNFTSNNMDGHHINGEFVEEIMYNGAFDLLQQQSSKSFTVYVSGKEIAENSPSEFNQFADAYFEDDSSIKIWLHFNFETETFPALTGDDGQKKLSGAGEVWVRFDNNLSIEEGEEELNNMFTIKRNEHVEVINTGQEELPSESDCGSVKKWGRNCVYHKASTYADDYIPGVSTYINANMAFYAGFIDGFLGTVSFILDAVQFVSSFDGQTVIDYTVTVINAPAIWLAKKIHNALKFESVSAYLKHEATNIVQSLKNTWNTAVKCWENFDLRETVSSAVNYFKEIFQKLNEIVGTHFNGSYSDAFAYSLGIVAFEIALSAITAGAFAAINGAKLFKGFKTLIKGKSVKSATTNSLAAAANSPKAWACKLLRMGCFVKDTPVLVANKNYSNPFRNNTKALAVAAAMPIVAVPIQEVQLLDYAVAHETVNEQNNLIASTDEDLYMGLLDGDPYTSPQQKQRDKYELNDTDWYSVSFEQVDGTSKCHFALTDDWIKKQGYESEKVVILNLPEQGINGPFRITYIKHIIPKEKPEGDAGDGYDWKPVTGLFEHQSNQVYELSFDNGAELGVTYQHPIYSITAGDWKLAGELEIGEEVLTKSGNTKVVSSTKKEGSEPVYNLEIKDLHNFLVTESGVVVHNGCAKIIADLLGIDLTKLVKAKRANNTSYNRILMKQGGEIDHKDAGFLDEIAESIGDDIVIPPKKNNPGFDGFSKSGGKTIEAKVLESTTVVGQQKGVVNKAKDAYDQIESFGKTPKTDVRIKADKITKAEAQDAWNGSTNAGTYNRPLDKWVDKIIVHCSDGIITLKG